MGDLTLRELEHRWKKSGAVEDEVRFRLEQVRSGQAPASVLEEPRLLLGRERVGHIREHGVALAAYLGHDSAREALSWKTPPGLKTSRRRLRRWCRRLGSFGKPAALRIALAATRSALPAEWSARARATAPVQRLIALVEAAEAWLREPTEARALAARELLDGVADRWRWHQPLFEAALATGRLASLPAPGPEDGPRERRQRCSEITQALTTAVVSAGEAAGPGREWSFVHQAIRQALFPWLLGP
jgi:hypothetical protein